MKKIQVLSVETFRCSWCGKPQPVGSVSREAVKQYILNDINAGRATIDQFKVWSNYGTYNVSEFITL